MQEGQIVMVVAERMAVLNEYAARLTERRFDTIELRGPGTELTIGPLPTAATFVQPSSRRCAIAA